MSTNEPRTPDLSELYSLVLSTMATTRARFNAILQNQARILARLEDRDQEEILEELREQFNQEREEESSALKAYLRRPASGDS